MIRSVLAALLTTALPAAVGARWFLGSPALRFGLGTLVGVAFLGAGAAVGAVAGLLLPGAAAGLLVAVALAPRLRLDLSDSRAADTDRRRAVLLGLVAAVGAVLLTLSVFRPVAWWDGWMVWSMKAKALAASGNFSGPVFTDPVYATSHPDYPPLFSAWQSVAYLLQGTSEVSWPLQLQLAWLWTAGAAGLVALAARRSFAPAVVVLAWVTAPHLVRQALSGYADVPMALLLVAGAALLHLPLDGVDPRRRTWVAGVWLAAGALCKVEGLVLALLVAAPLLAVRGRRGDGLRAGALAAASYLPWAIFVRVQGFSNDIASGFSESTPTVATMVARVPVVALWIGREVLWPLRWSVLVLGCAALLVLVRRVPWPLIATTMLSFGVFAAVWVTTPLDFDFHIRYSADRVVTAPLGFLALAAAVSLTRAPVGPSASGAAQPAREAGGPREAPHQEQAGVGGRVAPAAQAPAQRQRGPEA